MPCNCCNRDARRRRVRGSIAVPDDRVCGLSEDAETENIITDRFYCCGAPESIAEELYSPDSDTTVLLQTCYDANGLSRHDARKRCTFWPSFAHPRWLFCDELYDKPEV